MNFVSKSWDSSILGVIYKLTEPFEFLHVLILFTGCAYHVCVIVCAVYHSFNLLLIVLFYHWLIESCGFSRAPGPVNCKALNLGNCF